MFTALLNETERIAILRLLGNLAESDGQISESEVAHLKVVSNEMGLDIEDVFRGMEGHNLAELCTPIQRYESKVIAIVELMQLAFADRLVLDVERFKVRAIGELMGLEPEIVHEVEQWVIRGRKWQAEGRSLLKPK